MLRLSAEDSPEDIYEISPMERGLLIHDILEKFVEAAKSEGSLPAPQEEWTARHRAEMRRIAALQFEDTEAKGVAGKSVMWQIARDEILIDLDAFLDADLRMRQQFGVSPMLAEAEFGIGHDGWQPAVLALPMARRSVSAARLTALTRMAPVSARWFWTTRPAGLTHIET